MPKILHKYHLNAVLAISDEMCRYLRYSCQATMLVYFQCHFQFGQLTIYLNVTAQTNDIAY